MGDNMYGSDCCWKIPDDRQLALRGRLETGWSSYNNRTTSGASTHTNNNNNNNNTRMYITEEEQQLINAVLQKKELIQQQEQYRIGKLVTKLDHMKKSILGDGITTCLICGTTSGFLKDQLQVCGNCGKMVCGKCGVDVPAPNNAAAATAASTGKSTRKAAGKAGKLYYCVLCNEDKMLWKRSGAWFYNAIPKYEIPVETNDHLTPRPTRGNYNASSPGSLHSTKSSPSRGRRNSSLSLDMSSSHDSFDVSEDSDLDDTSVSPFQIPEDKLIAGCYINTDEDSRSLRSDASPGVKRGSNGSNQSMTSSKLEEVERLYQHKYSRHGSVRSATVAVKEDER